MVLARNYRPEFSKLREYGDVGARFQPHRRRWAGAAASEASYWPLARPRAVVAHCRRAESGDCSESLNIRRPSLAASSAFPPRTLSSTGSRERRRYLEFPSRVLLRSASTPLTASQRLRARLLRPLSALHGRPIVVRHDASNQLTRSIFSENTFDDLWRQKFSLEKVDRGRFEP